GALVAFHSGTSVYAIHVDGTGQTPITGTPGGYFWPRFSASDQELVFDRDNEIDAVALDGTGFRRIVQNSTTSIKAPTISPGGGELAYDVYCDTGYSIWTSSFLTTTDPCEGRRLTPVGEPASRK